MISERLEHYKAEFEKIAKDMVAEHGGEVDRVGFSMCLENGRRKSTLSIWYKAEESDDGLTF